MSLDNALSLPPEALAQAAREHDQHSQTAHSLQTRTVQAVRDAAQSYGPIGQPLSIALAVSAARNHARTTSASESHDRAAQLLRENQAGYQSTEQENASNLHKFSPDGAASPNQPTNKGSGDNSAPTTTFHERDTPPLPRPGVDNSAPTTTFHGRDTAPLTYDPSYPHHPLGEAGPRKNDPQTFVPAKKEH